MTEYIAGNVRGVYAGLKLTEYRGVVRYAGLCSASSIIVPSSQNRLSLACSVSFLTVERKICGIPYSQH